MVDFLLSNNRDEVIARLDRLGYTPEELREDCELHKSSTNPFSHPCLYCGTYAKYNDGDLTGMWIDLATFDNYDEFITFCQAIHADEDDPELMFQDCECLPEGWYSESQMSQEAFDRILHYVSLCDTYDKDALDTYLAWCDDQDFIHFEESYVGQWDSEEDFARHIVEECYDIDRTMGSLASYFDYEAFARDLFMSDYAFYDGHVFREC